jgi:hypothetical protein
MNRIMTMRGLGKVLGAAVALLSGVSAALGQSTTILNPTGSGTPPRAVGVISQFGERDAWLFYATGTGRATFAACGTSPNQLDARITVLDPISNQVLAGPVDRWGKRLTEVAQVNVQSGRWYVVLVDGLGARSIQEATGRYDVVVVAPGLPGRVPSAPRWPSAGPGNPGLRPPAEVVTRTIASWNVRMMAGQSSRVSDNCVINMGSNQVATVVVTGLPAHIRDQVRFTLMHDKRNASDQPRTMSIGHGSRVSGAAHNWPDFGTRIYIGRINAPWSREALFRAYPNFRVELRVTTLR